jgi:hypothetical protein
VCIGSGVATCRWRVPLADQGDQHMCFIRNMRLLMLMAIAAIAVAAPSAFAQTEPLVHNQAPRLIVQQEVHGATDANCPDVVPATPPIMSPMVTSGGCRLHVSGMDIIFTYHQVGGTEVVAATCDLEFDLRLDASGEGWITHQEFTGPTCVDGGRRWACGQQAPPTDEGRAWSAYLHESELAPRERLTAMLCTVPNPPQFTPQHCEIRIPVTEPTPHRYRFTMADASGHGGTFPHCELDGTLDVEAVLQTTGELQAEQRVEIRHT